MSTVPPPSEPPADVPHLFAAERARLLELLATVGTTDWHRPSPCPEWTVLGLCTHLLGGDFGLLARHRDGHYGTQPPAGSTDAEFIEWLDDLQIEWVRAARRLSPPLVVDLLAWTGPQLVEVFRRQDPRQRSALVSWAGTDPVPVWLDQVRELSEYWLHRQQLLQALDRPTDQRPELAEPILEGFRWAYPFRLADVPAEPGDTVSIKIAGPVTVTWLLVATPTGWDFRSTLGSQLVASLSMTTEQAWRLLSNNLSADEHDDLRTDGNERIIDVLRRTRAIIGSPK